MKRYFSHKYLKKLFFVNIPPDLHIFRTYFIEQAYLCGAWVSVRFGNFTSYHLVVSIMLTNHLFWLQWKALFLNVMYLHTPALSSPPTPYQVLSIKRLPKEHFPFQKRLQGFCVTSSVPILCLKSKAGAELIYITVKSLIDIGSDMFPVMQTFLDLISHLAEHVLVLVHASVQPMVKTLVCCTCHAMMLPATSTTTSTRHCLLS